MDMYKDILIDSFQLLRFSDKPITKIALKVGIQNPKYFARQFKKVEGMSPSEYKSKWL